MFGYRYQVMVLDWMVLNKCAWGLNLQIISGMFSAFALYGFILLFGAVLYAKAHSAVTLLGFSEPKAIFVRQNDVHDFRDTLQAKDIGEGFQHIFKVKNNGAYSTRRAVLNIRWPVSVVGLHGDLKWLLYLSQVGSGASCAVGTEYLDPLHFSNASRDDVNPFQKSPGDQSKEGPPNELHRWYLRLDCDRDRVNCITFSCDIPELASGEETRVSFIGRLWTRTLREDLHAFRVVYIRSHAELHLTVSSGNLTNRYPDDLITTAEITAVLEEKKDRESRFSWHTPLAAIVGVVVLLTAALIVFKNFYPCSKNVNSHWKSSDCKQGHRRQKGSKKVKFSEDEHISLQMTSSA